jgi:hypothetical protein
MNLFRPEIMRVVTAMLGFTLLTSIVQAVDTEQAAISAKNLAADLSALRNGTSYVRLRLAVKQPANTTKTTLQLQIKERRTKTGADHVYRCSGIERKGEGVLLRKTEGGAPTGSLYVPPEKPRTLSASQMNDPLFGSALSYQDVIENFFGWENQVIVGTEVLDRVSCLILESRPGKGDSSSYAKVRSWIDLDASSVRMKNICPRDNWHGGLTHPSCRRRQRSLYSCRFDCAVPRRFRDRSGWLPYQA